MAHRTPPEVAPGSEVPGQDQKELRRPAVQPLFQGSTLRALDDARIGRVIGGRYRLLSKVASGGVGVVYRAERVGLGRTVAVKFLRAPYADHPRYLSAFECEAEAMSRLSHPHCVPVIDYGVDEAPYLVMEFVPGIPLSTRLSIGPLPWEQAVRIQLQLLAGLAHAHGRQIVHRDIKPANIMLTEATAVGDHVRVLDFGLARLRDGAATVEPSQIGSIVGTPHYMAPEQWRSLPVDSRTDVYAAGIVLCEMLTGQVPFSGQSLSDCRNAHLRLAPPALADLNPRQRVSPALEAVVMRALQKDAEDRFPSAQAFHHALSQQLHGCAQTSPVVPVPSVTAAPRTRRSPAQPNIRKAYSVWRERAAESAGHLAAGAISFLIVIGAYLAGSSGGASRNATPEGTTASTYFRGEPENGRNSGTRSAFDEGGARVLDARESAPVLTAAAPVDDSPSTRPLTPQAFVPEGELPHHREPSSRRERVALIVQAMHAGQYDVALDHLRHMRVDEPRNAKWAYFVGKVYFERHLWSDAFLHYREAIRLDRRYRKQNDLILHLTQGLSDDETQQLAAQVLVQDVGASALAHLRRIAERDPRPSVRARAVAVSTRLRGR